VVAVTSFRIIVDVPETNYQIYNFPITAATGETITFSNYDLTFYRTEGPGVYATVVTSDSLASPLVTAKDNVSCVVNLVDIVNDHVDGNVDILIRGD
jgi:hypothetical protein